MTVLEQFLELPAFRQALSSLAEELHKTEPSALRTKLSVERVPQNINPDAVEGQKFIEAARAFGTLTDVGRREDHDKMVSDLLPHMPGVDSRSLLTLLEEGPEELERAQGRRLRDSINPILTTTKYAVDLRLVKPNDETQLAPVVMARFSFDEPITGSDSITFQMSAEALPVLISELQDLQHQVAELSEQLPNLRIAPWAGID